MIRQAEDICHRIGVIGRGQVLGEGTVAELCERTKTKNLRQAFFALVKDEPSVTVQTEIVDASAPLVPSPPGEG
jgi:ABC-type Na+ transport system ATPase subunit NatA